MKITILSALPLIAALSACGGSSTSEASFEENAFAFDSVNDGFDSSNALAAAYNAATETPLQNLPDGTARYDGVFLMFAAGDDQDGYGDGVVGQLQLSVNFDTKKLDGNVGSFINDFDVPVAGAVSISNGQIDTGTADVTGNIEFQQGVTTINGVGNFDFRGVGGELNSAIITGTLRPPTGPDFSIPVAGWTAERQ